MENVGRFCDARLVVVLALHVALGAPTYPILHRKGHKAAVPCIAHPDESYPTSSSGIKHVGTDSY